jgi:uncharacterized membrane protein YfcA
MFIISVLLAVLIAALSGMGVGGGGLLVIWLVLIMDMPSRTAQGINLVFFVISALAALPVHLRRRRLPTKLLLFLTATAIPGVFVGCQLASHLSEELMRRVFGYFLLLSGGWQLYRMVRRHFTLDYPNKS